MHVFDFYQVKWKHLQPPEMVFREPEVVVASYRINIFEKVRSRTRFRLCQVKWKRLRPPEILFRNFSRPIHVFDFDKSNGSGYGLQK